MKSGLQEDRAVIDRDAALAVMERIAWVGVNEGAARHHLRQFPRGERLGGRRRRKDVGEQEKCPAPRRSRSPKHRPTGTPPTTATSLPPPIPSGFAARGSESDGLVDDRLVLAELAVRDHRAERLDHDADAEQRGDVRGVVRRADLDHLQAAQPFRRHQP